MTTIHETVVRDIVDIAQGLVDNDEIQQILNRREGKSFKSITSRTEGLTMVFPVICSRNMEYTTAAMICKAIERKAVAMLHMLFSACNITDAENGLDYISRFHTNLKAGSFTVDDFISALDDFVEENALITNASDEENYRKIANDMRNMHFYFENNVNEVSLNDYKLVTVNETQLLVNTFEPLNEDNIPKPFTIGSTAIERVKQYNKLRGANIDALSYSNNVNGIADIVDRELSIHQDNINNKINALERRAARRLANAEFKHRMDTDAEDLAIKAKNAHYSALKNISDVNNNNRDLHMKRLVDQDIKKANELVPTLMYVNFIHKDDKNSSYPINSSLVIGVKAKLYAVDGEDILNRLKIKNNDRNLLLNLVKVSTHEISFFKDFVFAIDRAKLDTLSQSRRGSSSKLWKVLERRALKSRVRRSLSMVNDATAITTICLTQEEVEYFKKTEYIDIENPRIIRPIMEAYNMMGFCIADESLEVCKFIFDSGDDVYEVLTFDNLEKEQKDNSKKIINLMSKMNR